MWAYVCRINLLDKSISAKQWVGSLAMSGTVGSISFVRLSWSESMTGGVSCPISGHQTGCHMLTLLPPPPPPPVCGDTPWTYSLSSLVVSACSAINRLWLCDAISTNDLWEVWCHSNVSRDWSLLMKAHFPPSDTLDNKRQQETTRDNESLLLSVGSEWALQVTLLGVGGGGRFITDGLRPHLCHYLLSQKIHYKWWR